MNSALSYPFYSLRNVPPQRRVCYDLSINPAQAGEKHVTKQRNDAMPEPARALLPMLNVDEVSEGVQRILQAATKGNYQDPNIMRVLANAPDLLSQLLDYSKFLLYDSDIEHRLIELMRIKLAHLNDCHF